MRASHHVGAAALLLALVASACTGEVDEPAPSSPAEQTSAPTPDEPTSAATPDEPTSAATPDEPTSAATPDEPAPVEGPITYRRLTKESRRSFFGGAQDRDVRSVFPCDTGVTDLTDDPNLRDFDSTSFSVGEFSVIRQVALYPDQETAEATVALNRDFRVCGVIDGASRSDFAVDSARFFGLGGGDTVLSQASQSREGGGTFTTIDLVSTRGNAVVWTRIGSDRRVRQRSVVMAKVPANDPWFAVVRRQGNLGRQVFESLVTAPR